MKGYSVLVFFCSILFFSLHAQTIFFNPFSNKLFVLQGEEIYNGFDQLEKYQLPPNQNLNYYQPPLALSTNQILLTSNDGKILKFDLTGQQLTTLYRSKDKCSMKYNFSGCIYSMALDATGTLYFLLHQRNGNDDLISYNGKEFITKVTDIPGPSGPLWIRPNGNLGLLPYGHGKLEIALTQVASSFEQVLISSLELNSAAASAYEGGNTFLLFDYQQLIVFENEDSFVWDQASSVAFDSCTGMAWYLNNGELLTLEEERRHIAPINFAACPTITKWEAGDNDTNLNVIQGYPQGSPTIPSLKVLSLGNGGQVTLNSKKMIKAIDGAELRIFENAFQFGESVFSEPAKVELLSGNEWISTGCNCQAPDAKYCAGMQTTNSYPGNGIAPWTDSAGGLAIDLDNFGIKEMKQIRITDCGINASQGIYAGFDLDAIIVNPDALK